MVRVLALIFSLYILALTALPCVDVHKDEAETKIELSDTAHNHHNENDLCSPFCTCDCCVSPVLHIYTSIQISINVIAPHIYQEYQSALNSALFVTIWQPPQLA
ncbi:MAG: hypothetical protein KBG80_04705 [Breznakibacter sp.]|nr:hypothetical protein [Breznakibacter sp.]